LWGVLKRNDGYEKRIDARDQRICSGTTEIEGWIQESDTSGMINQSFAV
jgi:hypothetical protein